MRQHVHVRAPKNTTSGFRTPPHFRHGWNLNPSYESTYVPAGKKAVKTEGRNRVGIRF